MARRKGESGGSISTLQKLILFIVVTVLMVALYIFLKQKSLENIAPLFNLHIFSVD